MRAIKNSVYKKEKNMDYDYATHYEKWNTYKIGKVGFINARREHLSRTNYVDYIVNSNFTNVLEIGAGEVIEAQRIREQNSSINYTILDVSNLFLKNAKKLGFNTVKGEMTNTGFEDKEFDLVYLSAVLEHSPNIQKAMKELARISNNFYFTLFKWKMISGGLDHSYNKKSKCYSSVFNLNSLLDLINKYGNIKNMFISTLDGKYIQWDEYKKSIKDMDRHRNGNWLSIMGEW